MSASTTSRSVILIKQAIHPRFLFRPHHATARRRISSFRYNRHKAWSTNLNRDVADLYPEYTPPRGPDFKFPTIHFWDQDPDSGDRQHVATVRNEAELKELGKQDKAKEELLEEMEQDYDGPSSNLPSDSIVRLQARLKEVENEPEHQEALRRLMVLKPKDRALLEDLGDGGAEGRLQTDPELAEAGIDMVDIATAVNPASRNEAKIVDPKLRALNSALCLAYLGANEDIRSELWLAYSRAKGIEGVLEWIPDDAWDMIYWSQAAKWKSNTNREQHIRIVEEDLRSIGRNGPPTKDLM